MLFFFCFYFLTYWYSHESVSQENVVLQACFFTAKTELPVQWPGTNSSGGGKEHASAELTFRGPVSVVKVSTYVNNCVHITQCHNSDDHKVNFHRCEKPKRYTLGWSIQQQVRQNSVLTSLYGHPFWVPTYLGMRVCMFTPPISLSSRRSCYIWCTWVRWTDNVAKSIKIARCSWKACWNEQQWLILNKLHGPESVFGWSSSLKWLRNYAPL